MNFDDQNRKVEYSDYQSSIDNKNIMNALKDNRFKFIRNKGQLDKRVLYYAKAGMASFFFTRNKIVFSFLRSKNTVQETEPLAFNSTSLSEQREMIFERLVYSIRFIDSSLIAEAEGLDACEDTVNYFKGNDPKKWYTNVPCYRKIIYRNLYPSIDLVFRFNDGKLKYDFIVKPGASPEDINIACSGVD